MNFDKVLKIVLWIGILLVEVLGLCFFGRPCFLFGLLLLAALVELGFNRRHGYGTGGDGR